MALLTTAALNGYKEYTKRTISYAQYKVSSTYYKVPIKNIQVLTTGEISISFLIEPPTSGTATVTEVQLYDTNNNLWLSKTENLVKEAAQEGFYYLFKITIKEG